MDSGSVGRTDGGEGEDGRVRTAGGGGLSQWEDNVAYVTLGTEPNSPLAYGPGLELHHPIICTLGEHRGWL